MRKKEERREKKKKDKMSCHRLCKNEVEKEGEGKRRAREGDRGDERTTMTELDEETERSSRGRGEEEDGEEATDGGKGRRAETVTAAGIVRTFIAPFRPIDRSQQTT